MDVLYFTLNQLIFADYMITSIIQHRFYSKVEYEWEEKGIKIIWTKVGNMPTWYSHELGHCTWQMWRIPLHYRYFYLLISVPWTSQKNHGYIWWKDTCGMFLEYFIFNVVLLQYFQCYFYPHQMHINQFYFKLLKLNNSHTINIHKGNILSILKSKPHLYYTANWCGLFVTF